MTKKMEKDSRELRAIRQELNTSNDPEQIGIAWLLNPEQAKLRRELPFLAAALDCCLKHISRERLDELDRKLRGDLKTPSTKEQRRQDAWAKHKAKRRTNHKGNERPHDPHTGQFLKEAK
jgi:hypothetical protein